MIQSVTENVNKGWVGAIWDPGGTWRCRARGSVGGRAGVEAGVEDSEGLAQPNLSGSTSL